MTDVPRGMQRRTLAKEHPANLAGRNALFALENGVENLKPTLRAGRWYSRTPCQRERRTDRACA
jgi:hypothetical protein